VAAPNAPAAFAQRKSVVGETNRGAYLLPSLVGRFSGAARPILRAFAIPLSCIPGLPF
jgi:hypothetical protein